MCLTWFVVSERKMLHILEDTERQRGGRGEESERWRWILSEEMWFPLTLTPTSCLCYFCHNLYIFPPLPQSTSIFLFLVVFSCVFHSLLFPLIISCLSFCLLPFSSSSHYLSVFSFRVRLVGHCLFICSSSQYII